VSRNRKITSAVLVGALLWVGGLHTVLAQATTGPVRGPARGPALDDALGDLRRALSPAGGEIDARAMRSARRRIAEEYEQGRRYLREIGRLLSRKNASWSIRERHEQAVRDFETRHAELEAVLRSIEAEPSGTPEAVDEAVRFLDAHTSPARRSPVDPSHLPHRGLSAEPATEEAESSDPPLSRSSSALVDAAPPAAADLAETVEVRFTSDVTDLAMQLGHNPVRIFNWVRNNVAFNPVWGSIQGAQGCLETRRCNAFDTSSLLIALLRASGIAARYQMGTVEVAADRLMTWAGGFTDPTAAASFFAGGGVPSVTRRVSGTDVVSVKLEHVWVVAHVDYVPSGGAVHATGDTWIEMDAAFKETIFPEAFDFDAVLPVDTDAFQQILDQATVDPVTGSVTGIDSDAIDSLFRDSLLQRFDYARTNLAGQAAGEALGVPVVSDLHNEVLAATLPYRVLARNASMAEIADSLRHRFRFTLTRPDGTEILDFSASLPELADQELLLLYSPASQDDEDLIAALGPTGTALPSSIRVLPRLWVGDAVLAEGGPLRLGEALVNTFEFVAPTIPTPPVSNGMRAGEALAIGLDVAGISPDRLQRLEDRAARTETLLSNGQTAMLSAPDAAAALLSTNITGWFALVDFFDRHAANTMGVATVRFPSAGIFSAKLAAATLFGAPSSVLVDSLGMDVDRDIVLSVARDGDLTKVRIVSSLQGTLASALEAQFPVSSLSAPGSPVSGIATAQALRMANDEGIPVYSIDAGNAAAVLPRLQVHRDDLATIENALGAGLEVVVSERPVDFHGNQVLGMELRDPLTGSAAYLISGGTNGALIVLVSTILIAVMLLVFGAIGAITVTLAATLAVVVGVVGAAIASLLLLLTDEQVLSVFCIAAFILIGVVLAVIMWPLILASVLAAILGVSVTFSLGLAAGLAC